MRNFTPNKRIVYVAEGGEPRDGGWYLDSGATDHVSNDFSNLSINTQYKGNNQLVVGNGSKLKIASIVHTLLIIFEPYVLQHIKLNQILYVPEITKNLIRISKILVDNNVYVEFDKYSCVVKDKKRGTVFMKDVVKDGLYELLSLPHNNNQAKSILLSSTLIPCLIPVSTINKPKSILSVNLNGDRTSNKNLRANEILDLWYRRLGHLNIIAF